MSDDDVTDEMLLGAMARVANHMDVVGRLQRENAALAAEVERVKGEADEARANLILQTICRLPSVLTTDDWQDFLEEHRHEWLNDDRAFGGWVSQRLSVAIATARADAIEHAAKVCEFRAQSNAEDSHDYLAANEAGKCAVAVRWLITQPERFAARLALLEEGTHE